MRRAMAMVCIILGLGALISAAPPKPPRSVSQKLAQQVQFPGIDDPRTTLNDALELLAKRYNLSFDINEKAFKADGMAPEVGRTEIASPKTIPPMKNVRVDKVLKTILLRVPAPSGAAYRVRGDTVEITTQKALKDLKSKDKKGRK